MNTTTKTQTIVPLSQSRFEVMACPVSYAEKIVHGQKEPPNPFSIRGTVIHSKVSHYIDHLVKSRQSQDVETYDLLIADVSGEAREILERMRDSIKIDADRILGTELYLALDEDMRPIETYGIACPDCGGRGRRDVPITGAVARIEEDVKCYACDGRGFFTRGIGIAAFEGTLDLIESPDSRTLDIRDWKSFWQICDVDTFQSRLYPLLAFLHYPDIETIRFHLHFVRYGVTRSVEFTRDRDLPKLIVEARRERHRQLKIHTEVAAGVEVEALPGAHCVYCPLLTEGCPIAEINPYTEQTPEDRAKFKAWLTAANKANDAILKDFTQFAPVIFTDGNGNRYAAGFHLTEKSSYPASTCLPIINANDPELAQKVMLSGMSTPLRAKKRQLLASLIEPHRIVTQQTRFYIDGVPDEEGESE